jgi:hypothetical protein
MYYIIFFVLYKLLWLILRINVIGLKSLCDMQMELMRKSMHVGFLGKVL